MLVVALIGDVRDSETERYKIVLCSTEAAIRGAELAA
jgi:hypothetical protein